MFHRISTDGTVRLLKEQDFMKNFDFYDVDYCKYGFEYRKRTQGDQPKNWTPIPLCKKNCNSIVGNRHKETTQRLPCGANKERRHKMNYTEYLMS